MQVGTQVSGTVQALTRISTHRAQGPGDRAARPVVDSTQIEQQRANVVRAEADLSACVGLAASQAETAACARSGQARLIPQTEVEAADVAVLSQSVDPIVNRGLTQARANLNQQQSTSTTVITAPIDGIVISATSRGRPSRQHERAVLYLLAPTSPR